MDTGCPSLPATLNPKRYESAFSEARTVSSCSAPSFSSPSSNPPENRTSDCTPCRAPRKLVRRQRQLDRLVALKILPESLAREPAFAERFAREARALAALNHPNIVTIHDFGQSDGLFFLLMEFVDGMNLRQLIRSQWLSPEQALTIVPPLCDALQFAHERGIVHRDIKPENLLLDRSGRIKVADFGIARMLASDGPERGSTAASDADRESLAAGTPGYMAPEQQAAPATVYRRVDIYALGVVLYEMLTGEPSYRGVGRSGAVGVDAAAPRLDWGDLEVFFWGDV